MKKNSDTPPRITGSFTQVKHKVLEAWSRFYLPSNTWKVYFAIYRETIGWHEEWSKISRDDFKEKTWLNDREIKKSLAILKQTNFIHKKGYSKNPNYKVNQHFTTWKKYLKTPKGCLCVNKGTPRQQKRVPQENDSSYSNDLKKKEKKGKPFSFEDFEKSKNQKERSFFEIFINYPKRTGIKKAWEICRRTVTDPEDWKKLKLTVEHYTREKKKSKENTHNLDRFMEIWPDRYGEYESIIKAREKMAADKKKADRAAAADRKKWQTSGGLTKKQIEESWLEGEQRSREINEANKKGG